MLAVPLNHCQMRISVYTTHNLPPEMCMDLKLTIELSLRYWRISHGYVFLNVGTKESTGTVEICQLSQNWQKVTWLVEGCFAFLYTQETKRKRPSYWVTQLKEIMLYTIFKIWTIYVYKSVVRVMFSEYFVIVLFYHH